MLNREKKGDGLFAKKSCTGLQNLSIFSSKQLAILVGAYLLTDMMLYFMVECKIN